MNTNGESRRWLARFYGMDSPSLKDLLLANMNLVLDEEAVSQVKQSWDSIFLDLEEGVIGAKLEDLPVASLVSEPDVRKAIETAKDLRESKRSRIMRALEGGRWCEPQLEGLPPRTRRKPEARSVVLAYKSLLGAPHRLLKEQEKAKQRVRYLRSLRDRNVEWVRLKALRDADKCALTSVKRARDAVFGRIPEDLWGALLFCPTPRPDPETLKAEAAEVAKAIQAMTTERSMQGFRSP